MQKNETTLNNETDIWADDRNMTFSCATQRDFGELRKFLSANFFTAEPLSKCGNLLHGYAPIDLYGWYLSNSQLIGKPLSKNETGVKCSLIARDKTSNVIVGCKIGAIYSKDEIGEHDLLPKWMRSLPSFMIPYKLTFGFNLESLQKDLHYSHQEAFDDLRDATSIYMSEVLCVAEEARGKGLGYELTKRACRIALDAGCKYTYLFATSMYSQRIFHKFNGCKVLHEVKYKDYEYDNNGRPFLLDHGVHQVIQVISLDNTLD